MKISSTGFVLNIGEGHPLDLILVRNITNEKYTTLWEKQPFSIEANSERSLLRYIAVKFARELVEKIIGEKAAKEGKSIINFTSLKVPLSNKILVRVEQPYLQIPQDKRHAPSEQAPLQPGEVPVDLGRVNVLQELGISDKPVKSGPEDVAANIVNIKPLPKEGKSPQEIRAEKEKLVKRAKDLGLDVNIKMSLEKIKEAILYGK